MTTAFPLEYIDWAKKVKHAKTLKETENPKWVEEFYHSKEWGEKPVNGIEWGIATGRIF